MIMPRPSSKFDLALEPGKDHALVLRRQLLTWWQAHGRKDPAQKPWMVTADGCWPLLDQLLDPYGIWIAEVMLHFATQEA